MKVRALLMLASCALFLLTLLRMGAILQPPPSNSAVELGEVPRVKLTVLVDNNPNPFNRELIDAWGLSILVEAPSITILFDAGPSPRALQHNSKALAVDLKRASFVVISHEHRDHVGGLEYVAEVNSNVTIYIPGHASRSVEKWIRDAGLNNIVRVYGTVKLASGVAVVGELYGPPHEQALAVNVEGLGLIILVGCSHPGVCNIVEKISRELGIKPYAVVGGFHLAGAPAYELEEVVGHLISLGVKKIYPMHCSGGEVRKLLRSKYSERYGEAHVGSIIELG